MSAWSFSISFNLQAIQNCDEETPKNHKVKPLACSDIVK